MFAIGSGSEPHLLIFLCISIDACLLAQAGFVPLTLNKIEILLRPLRSHLITYHTRLKRLRKEVGGKNNKMVWSARYLETTLSRPPSSLP